MKEDGDYRCMGCGEIFVVYGDIEDYLCSECGYEFCNDCTYQFREKQYCEECFEKVKELK